MHDMVLENDRSHYFGLFGPFSYCEIMTELNNQNRSLKFATKFFDRSFRFGFGLLGFSHGLFGFGFRLSIFLPTPTLEQPG
jgi:hypothetical protein